MKITKSKGFHFYWLLILLIIGLIIEILLKIPCISTLPVLQRLIPYLENTLFSDNSKIWVTVCTTVGSVTFSIFSFSKSTLKSYQTYVSDELCQLLNINLIYNSYIFVAIVIQLLCFLFSRFVIFYLMVLYQMYSFFKCCKNYINILNYNALSTRVIKSIKKIEKKEDYTKLYQVISLFLQTNPFANDRISNKNKKVILGVFDKIAYDIIHPFRNDSLFSCPDYSRYNNAVTIIENIKNYSTDPIFIQNNLSALYFSISQEISKELNVFTLYQHDYHADNYYFYAILIINILKTNSKQLYEELKIGNPQSIFKDYIVILYFEILRFNSEYCYSTQNYNLYSSCIRNIKLFSITQETDYTRLLDLLKKIWTFELLSDYHSDIYKIALSYKRFKGIMSSLDGLIHQEKTQHILNNKHLNDVNLINILKHTKGDQK